MKTSLIAAATAMLMLATASETFAQNNRTRTGSTMPTSVQQDTTRARTIDINDNRNRVNGATEIDRNTQDVNRRNDSRLNNSTTPLNGGTNTTNPATPTTPVNPGAPTTNPTTPAAPSTPPMGRP